MENGGGGSTAGKDYAQRIARLSLTRWKQVLNVQAVYRWNIRRLHLGRTLDVGCGLGRNLEHLGSNAVGVDHNAVSIAVARSRGLRAYTCEEFAQSPDAVPGSYDSLLFAHVLEHLDRDHAVGLLKQYLPYLEPGGHVVVITPQERGFRSDTTHVTFIDFASQRLIATAAGLDIIRQFSFPLPRVAGRLFVYNEFVAVTRFQRDSASRPSRGGCNHAPDRR
jgi:2-polyprenyl-3-methyl-5-hydroxy-6-metoxy-1,4-benzoquinol methylase